MGFAGIFSMLTLVFLLSSNFSVNAQNIVKAEYFFNTDPGWGLGENITIATPAENIENMVFTADASALVAGFNMLFIRAKDATGLWSLTHQQPFYKAAMTLELPLVVQAEYFFNTDPGQGFGTSIPITTPSVNIQQIDFIADANALNTGFNMLLIRAKDANGKWTLTHQKPLYKAAMDLELPDIVRAEYFIDGDPGPGMGTNIPVGSPASSIENLTFIADVGLLEPGHHIMFIRAKDTKDKWTLTHVRQFYKASMANDLANIVEAEYYIDSDPGTGNGIPVPIALPANKIEEITFVFDIGELALGFHKTFLRAKDETGKWSLTNVYEFCKTPIPDFTTDIAEFGNPTTFTNLSQQYNQDSQFFWDVDGDGTYDYTGAGSFLHLYTAPGSYLAKLKVQIPEGCFDIVEKEVLVYACMIPTNLTAENITYNSAELNWTPGNFGSQWNILWGLQGFDPETEGTLIEGVAEQPYFLSELEDQTAYDFYVRTVCDDEVSTWSGPKTFTTMEYFCPPDWQPGAYFQYNMQIIGKLFIDGEQSFNPHDVVGAFVDGECRGMAAPDPDLFGLVFLTVGSDVASGEMVEFVIWNVAECAECPTGESMIFENQLQVGTPGNPYPFECGQHELPFTFGEGYTWFSVNLNPGSMALNEVFAGLSPCEEDRILGQNAFAVVYNGAWVGSLTAIAPSQMYKMQLCSQQNLTIEGQPVANDPISLGAGYTWLGYLPQGGLNINDALAGLQPVAAEDNRLIGQNAFAVYYQGQWIGSLTQLHPGKGYIVELSNQSILTYPAATDQESMEPENEIVSPTGEMPMAFQQFNMMLIAQLELPDGTISLNPEDVIYAFSGNECRGMAVPSHENGGMLFMSIGSDTQAGEEITFKAWLSEFGTLEEIKETISFEALKKAGTAEQPVLLTLKGFTGMGVNTAEGIYIGEPFPNPFGESTEIAYRLNVSAQVRLSLSDSHGQSLGIIMDEQQNPGLHTATIQRNDLPPGVYFYRMEIFIAGEAVQKNGKIIIQ